MRAARIGGCLTGVALAALLLVLSRPAVGGEAVGAEVRFDAALNGTLEITPAAPTPFLRERALRPEDGPAAGSFVITNQSGQAQAIRLRLTSSDPALDGVLRVALSSGGTTIAAGTLGSLARPSGPLTLQPGGRALISASAELPADAPAASWQAALVDVSVIFVMRDAR